ncbi:MAG: LPS assembly lipoprotein LptE [Rubrivivax sp.]
MRRRAALRRLAALGAAACATTLGACGFHLRQPLALPFKSIALTGFEPRSPLEAELRRSLAAVVSVKAVPTEAEVVLHAQLDRRERSVAASTAAGQVREIQLRVHTVLRADARGGRALIAPFELRLTRDLPYIESAALAKAQEEGELFREMQSDVVDQVMRRLAAVRM